MAAKRRRTRGEAINKASIDLARPIKRYEAHNRSEGKAPRTAGGTERVSDAF